MAVFQIDRPTVGLPKVRDIRPPCLAPSDFMAIDSFVSLGFRIPARHPAQYNTTDSIVAVVPLFTISHRLSTFRAPAKASD